MCRSISAKPNIDTDLTPERVHVTTAQGGDMAIKQSQLGTTQATVWKPSMTEYTQITWASNKCLNLDRYATSGAPRLRALLPSFLLHGRSRKSKPRTTVRTYTGTPEKGPPKHFLHNLVLRKKSELQQISNQPTHVRACVHEKAENTVQQVYQHRNREKHSVTPTPKPIGRVDMDILSGRSYCLELSSKNFCTKPSCSARSEVQLPLNSKRLFPQAHLPKHILPREPY
jgi:hypothetical protein